MVLVPPKAQALAIEPPAVSSYFAPCLSRLRLSVSAGLKEIAESSAFSGRPEALAGGRQSTRVHEIELFTPPHHPYDTSDEEHASTGGARTRDAEGPPRLPHHTAPCALLP